MKLPKSVSQRQRGRRPLRPPLHRRTRAAEQNASAQSDGGATRSDAKTTAASTTHVHRRNGVPRQRLLQEPPAREPPAGLQNRKICSAAKARATDYGWGGAGEQQPEQLQLSTRETGSPSARVQETRNNVAGRQLQPKSLCQNSPANVPHARQQHQTSAPRHDRPPS